MKGYIRLSYCDWCHYYREWRGLDHFHARLCVVCWPHRDSSIYKPDVAEHINPFERGERGYQWRVRKMEMQAVKSSNVAAVGWEDGLLEVHFHPAKEGTPAPVYRYLAVPRSVYDGLLSAKSVGVYFSLFVKGQYKYLRVDE